MQRTKARAQVRIKFGIFLKPDRAAAPTLRRAGRAKPKIDHCFRLHHVQSAGLEEGRSASGAAFGASGAGGSGGTGGAGGSGIRRDAN